MRKEKGSVLLVPNREEREGQVQGPLKRPKTKDEAVKELSDRRREISKSKDALHLAGKAAERVGELEGVSEAFSRWDLVHNSRHLISPRADAFFQHDGLPCHAQKSRLLKRTAPGGRTHEYTLNDALPSVQTDRCISTDLLDFRFNSYFSLQLDVMNAIHYRGDDGDRGTKVKDIVTSKMKRLLRKWITGDRAKRLEQLHLHIDDPSSVIAQKGGEQRRRNRSRAKDDDGFEDIKGQSASNLPEFTNALMIPWSHLLNDRSYKDELASLHLLCAAIAAQELIIEQKKRIIIYLHGGAFLLPRNFHGQFATQFTARRFTDEDLALANILDVIWSTLHTLHIYSMQPPNAVQLYLK